MNKFYTICIDIRVIADEAAGVDGGVTKIQQLTRSPAETATVVTRSEFVVEGDVTIAENAVFTPFTLIIGLILTPTPAAAASETYRFFNVPENGTSTCADDSVADDPPGSK